MAQQRGSIMGWLWELQDEQETCARDMIYPDRVGPSKDLPISVMSRIGMATVVDGTHPA